MSVILNALNKNLLIIIIIIIIMSMELGLSVMGDCQCSYTGS